MRDKLIEFLKKELVGPDPKPPYVQENGEEIIPRLNPNTRYSVGILYPQEDLFTNNEELETNDELEDDEEEDNTDIDSAQEKSYERESILHKIKTNTEDNDELLNLSNAYLPSAMGISCFLKVQTGGLKVLIRGGRYKKGKYPIKKNDGTVKDVSAYYRESIDTEIYIPHDKIPTIKNPQSTIPILKQNRETGLSLYIVNRSGKIAENSEYQIITFSLVNELRKSDKNENINCFFQVGFEMRSNVDEECFFPYPTASIDSDEISTQLLYSHKKTYAIGHGCSPVWEDSDNSTSVSKIIAETLPMYEMKPILPFRSPSVNLKMYDMIDESAIKSITNNLNQLCYEYGEWINKQEGIINEGTSEELSEAARKNIKNCKYCLERMKEGASLIEDNEHVRKAFLFMNKSMLLQQLHFGLKTREWKPGNKIEPWKAPEISDTQTWPDKGTRLGNWYPFQLAFIMMNIKSIFDESCEERKIVDIIWFPTGGGKTEAYLGLSAFTIFLRRLRNQDDDGTAILMRYTLRLLTAQQFQRASSMICACELIRKEREHELGKNRITIGLWVGDDVSPNSRADAVRKFKDIKKNENKKYPFIIYKCPWCGAGMGPVMEKDQIKTPVDIKGYSISRNPSTVIFKCSDKTCSFSTEQTSLPLLVIDQDIYESPPTLIIGTVDKFAMMVWKPNEIRSLFGYRDNLRIKPPELIIQDELHLISGPLGSMVGHYEILVDELCKSEDGKTSKAKIIASTATLSRAKEQVNALYNCGEKNVFLFPPQAINAADSFFAKEDSTQNGRKYVGIHASGLSHATAHIRVISALLQAVRSVDAPDSEKNYYWTILDYFNSLRELGHAVTRIYADIPEYLSRMWQRMGLSSKSIPDLRRLINSHIELTSRVESGEISKALKELEVNYPQLAERIKPPVDVCLATNMVSVGVDIPRLGLMTVTGQPKTTSEYIQTTSRVGRSASGPGLVVVVYNTSKPRDRSHYERFHSYHSKIYSFVEPTSITPYSTPVMERALHAILVGLVRYLGSENNRKSPDPSPSNSLFERIEDIVRNRVSGVEISELKQAIDLLKRKIHHWQKLHPPYYGSSFPTSWDKTVLMFPNNVKPPDETEEVAWPTPTSMRNVDASCNAKVSSYYMDNNKSFNHE